MRVRISYGTDIENVPKELQKLFSSVSEETHNTSRKIHRIEEFLHEDEIESAINLMEKLRLNLAEIDNKVSDVMNIATGYVNYKESEGAEDVEQRRPSVDTAAEHPPNRDAQQPTGNPHHAGT